MAEQPSTVTTPLFSISSAVQKRDEVEFVLDFVERSDKVRRRFVPIWDEVLSNYLVSPYSGGDTGISRTRQGTPVPMGPRERGRAILKDPETHQIVETITSQAMNLLLGSREYITAIPIGRDDYDKARLLSRLLMAIFEQPGIWRTHYQLFKDAFLFGTAIIEIGWETRSRQQYVRKGRRLVKDEVVYRDMPMQRAVDIYNFYWDPSGTRIHHDMVGVAKRFEITVQEAERLAQKGPNGEPPVYDTQDVKDAIQRRRDEMNSSTKYGQKRFDQMPSATAERFEIMDGFEYWGESPVRASDGMSNRVITLLNGVRVRSRGNPFIDGAIPFKEIVVNPIAGRFPGLAPAEVIRFLQDNADATLMNLSDAVANAIHGPLLVGNAWQGNLQQLKERKLLDVIPCQDVKQVGVVPVDYNVLQLAAADLMRGKMSMRESAGSANNVQQSIPSQGDKTATEISLMERFGTQRVEAMVQLIERDDYPWIGRTLHSRLKQFLPDGGAMATLAGEAFPVPLEAVDIDADVRFGGSRLAGSKFQIMARYEKLATVLGTEAGQRLAILYPEVLVRMFRDGLEIVDAEDIIGKATQRALSMLKLQTVQNMQQPQAGGSPPGTPNQEQQGTEPEQAIAGGEALQ